MTTLVTQTGLRFTLDTGGTGHVVHLDQQRTPGGQYETTVLSPDDALALSYALQREALRASSARAKLAGRVAR